ncbi:MAG: redoxin domain-containing protein [Chloroherpetonaceae bacterium]|nr:redoxin domain-containing protein [Chthonomonadaceae bacterium]MDW8208369.1 redoxin domain-containing protein [Chloroherpetonaceae bacterium]
MHSSCLRWIAVGLGVLLASSVSGQGSRMIGRPAPAFTAPDVEGNTRTIGQWRGRPLVILFFCSCDACRPVAQLWGEAQATDALRPASGAVAPTSSQKTAPETLVFFAGDVEATRKFAGSVGLDPAQTILFPDYTFRTARRYNAIPCPRIFVVDRQGIVRYTNNEAGGKPDETPAPVLVSRAITATHQAFTAGSPPVRRATTSSKAKGERRAPSRRP